MRLAAALAAAPAGAAPALQRPFCATKGDGALPVAFRARDGARVRGLLVGSGTLGIVLGHQTGRSDLCEWCEHARELAGEAFRVLAVDFRGFGSSPVPARLSTTALERAGSTA